MARRYVVILQLLLRLRVRHDVGEAKVAMMSVRRERKSDHGIERREQARACVAQAFLLSSVVSIHTSIDLLCARIIGYRAMAGLGSSRNCACRCGDSKGAGGCRVL